MVKTILVVCALLATAAAGLTLTTTTGRGAAQATSTAGPIVIEFSTATTAAGEDPATVESTNTPVVFEIATAATAGDADTTATAAATEGVGDDDDEGDGDDDGVPVAASDWTGGFYQADPELQAYYGRPWVAVYGAQSEYPAATLAFSLDDQPDEPITLTVLGLDDELEGLNPIAIEVNGRRVYEGDNLFVNWNAVTGDPSVWSQVGFRIAPELLEDGDNTITLINLTPSSTFGGPPYFLLGDARFSGGDVEISVGTTTGDDDQDDDALATSEPGNGNRGNGGDNGNDDNSGNDDSPGNGNGNGNDDDEEEDEDSDG